MDIHDLDWDDIRMFLAVAEHQSVSKAANALSVSQPTAGRHISRLENQIGLQLFDRRQSGFALTESGHRLFEAAQSMAQSAADFQRAVDLEKIGEANQVCRITLGEWGQYFLTQHADALLEGLEGVRLEFYADDVFWDLSRNAADIAVGNRAPKHAHLIAQKLGQRQFHVYASRGFLKAHPAAASPSNWKDQIWAGYCGTRAQLRSAKLLSDILEGKSPRFSVNSSVALLRVLLSDQAMGILPDWIGEEEDLVRVSDVPLATSQSWLSFHERLRFHPQLSKIKTRVADLYRHRFSATGSS
ncbi:LysR family transcriptional regulator [Roseibium sp.]|uniref:LysR family transcriptional regulator n=1 Tax=Roseibium sp. TaxID=1936156 RepID=UPI0039EF186B